MTPTLWALLLIWSVLLIYALAASVDFGAGFWSMYLMGHSSGASDVASRYVSPLWEVTNVFLVLFAVGLVGFFPHAAFAYGTVLLIPGSLILILLTLRGSFLVFSYASRKWEKMCRVVSGLTGLLLPSLFVSVLPISEGGFVTDAHGHYRLLFGKLVTSPVEYAYLAFGLATELFFSALLMADYSKQADNEHAYRTFRRQALRLGPVTLVTAVLVQVLLPSESAWLQSRLQAAWPAFLLSLLAFVTGYGALWIKGRKKDFTGLPRVAVVAVAIQYAIAHFAYGWAHAPYLLYPFLTAESSFTNEAMFTALLVVLVAGLAVLFPAFIWFWRLFMEDKRYVADGGKKY
jgi:cytochrome d ubiquinol oxidase subunit II